MQLLGLLCLAAVHRGESDADDDEEDDCSERQAEALQAEQH